MSSALATALPLQDIQLPPAPGWWPPAPGWWLLLTLILLSALLALVHWRRGRYRRAALRQLARLQARAAEGSELAVLSQLLRQAALRSFPTSACAGLQGEAWLAFLDQSLPHRWRERGFRGGIGRCLAVGPYQPGAALSAVERQELYALCRRWLRALPTVPRRGAGRRRP